MLLANVLNPEVVDDEGERDWSPFVRPKSWGGLALGVPVFLESFGQEFLGDDSRLGEAIHALPDFAVDVTVWRRDVSELVVRDHVVGHVRQFQSHVLVPLHWRAQVKILDVHREESCSRCRYDAVDQ